MDLKRVIKHSCLLIWLLLLNACGDKCFEDITFPANGGQPYVTKSEQISVPANSQQFIHTSQTIPKGSNVTISISGGPVYLCGKNKNSQKVPANQQAWTTLIGPNSITQYATLQDDALQFTVGCDSDDQESQCLYAPCNPTIESVDCSQWPDHPLCNCVPNPPLIGPLPGCQVKTSGYVNPCQNDCKTVQGQSCTYTGLKDTTCVSCKSKIKTCSDVNKKFYNSSSCIQLGSSAPYSATLNQWDVGTAINPYVNTFCNSIKSSKAFEPPSTVSDHGAWVSILYENIGLNGQYIGSAQHCWFTAGMGMMLRIITDDDAQGCSDEYRSTDQLTWFVNNPVSKSDIQNLTPSWFDKQHKTMSNDFTLVRCAGDSSNIGFDKCLSSKTHIQNTVVQRMIQQTPQAKYYCARVADSLNDYGDNGGGYVVNITGKTCIAQYGYSMSSGTTLGALQYKTSDSGNASFVVDIKPQGAETNSYIINNYDATSPIYFRVYDTTGEYDDNIGIYTVLVTWDEYFGGTGGISKAIQNLRNMLREIVFTNMPEYYHSMTCPHTNCCDGGVCKSPYIQYIRALLVLYIIFFGFAFIMGFAAISQKDLIIRVVKIGVVLQLISPGSWEFFNNTLFSFFINGTDELIRLATFVSCGGDTGMPCPPVFSFIDKMFDLLFLDKAIWMKVLAILFISPIGFVLGILLIIGMFYFLLGIISAITEYLMAIIAVAALVLLGPIFIPFILFSQTRGMFDTWLKMMFRYSMEPVFLVVGLSFLFEIYYSIFREMFEFNSCWKCMWGIEFPKGFDDVINRIFHLGRGDSFLCFQAFGPWGMAPSGGGSIIAALGVETSGLLLLIILSAVVRNYAKFVSSVMSQLIGQRASIWRMTGGQRQQYGSAGEAVLKSGPIAGLEKKVGQAARTGAFKALGIKTGKDEEKELEAYQQSLTKRGKAGAPSGGTGSGTKSNSSSSSGGAGSSMQSSANTGAGAVKGAKPGSTSSVSTADDKKDTNSGSTSSDKKDVRAGVGTPGTTSAVGDKKDAKPVSSSTHSVAEDKKDVTPGTQPVKAKRDGAPPPLYDPKFDK